MRFASALAAVLLPCLAAGYAAVRYGALGADGGVLWCITLIAVLLTLCVVGAHLERRSA